MHHRLQVLLGVSLLWGGCDRPAGPPATPTAPAAIAPASAVAAAPIVAAPAPTAAAPAAPAAGAASHFGAPLSAAPAIAAQALLADPAKYDDKDIKVTGQVSAACQRKGCWMTIGSGEAGAPTVRISFKDYGFFVPTDCMGKMATVEGRFKVTTLSRAEAQHYADDAAKAGTAPQKVTAPQRTLSMVATGVELL